jgi:hypothetical protein
VYAGAPAWMRQVTTPGSGGQSVARVDDDLFDRGDDLNHGLTPFRRGSDQ